MELARVILFTGQLEAMGKFYGETLGLKQVTNEKGWREFAAGGARIALHSGPSPPGRTGQGFRARAAARHAVDGRRFVSATARILMVIQFNCPIDEARPWTRSN